jgi:hypothetical protein
MINSAQKKNPCTIRDRDFDYFRWNFICTADSELNQFKLWRKKCCFQGQ